MLSNPPHSTGAGNCFGKLSNSACPWRVFTRLLRHPGQWFLTTATLFLILMTLQASIADSLPVYERVRTLSAAHTITDFQLTDQNGRPFQLSSLRGRAVLVLFGFTNCPDICPMGMEQLRQLEASGQINHDKIAYVMISVDGERDTPDAMMAYVQRFSPRFIGLTGNPTEVKQIAKEFSAVFFKGSVTGEDGEYSVSHSPQIFVLDPAGHLRAEFYNASIEAMTGITMALLNESFISPEQADDS